MNLDILFAKVSEGADAKEVALSAIMKISDVRSTEGAVSPLAGYKRFIFPAIGDKIKVVKWTMVPIGTIITVQMYSTCCDQGGLSQYAAGGADSDGNYWTVILNDCEPC